jgi:hypothetical protein
MSVETAEVAFPDPMIVQAATGRAFRSVASHATLVKSPSGFATFEVGTKPAPTPCTGPEVTFPAMVMPAVLPEKKIEFPPWL